MLFFILQIDTSTIVFCKVSTNIDGTLMVFLFHKLMELEKRNSVCPQQPTIGTYCDPLKQSITIFKTHICYCQTTRNLITHITDKQ